MSPEQRQIAIRESGFRCPVTGVQYDKRTYFEIEESLHPFQRLTADHWDGRRRVNGRKVDEESDNIVVLLGIAHDHKDNASRDGQITWLDREISAAVSAGEAKRVAHMGGVLAFMKADPAHDLKAYLASVIEERGPLSATYDRAKEKEYAAEPKRREKKARSRRDQYQRSKKRVGGTPLSKQKKAKPAPRPGKKWASSKWAWAEGLPVLNGTPKSPTE